MRLREPLSLLAAIALGGCAEPRRPRPVDPRVRFATACDDPRFVAAAPHEVHGLRSARPTAAFFRAQRVYAGASPTGVFATDGATFVPLGPSFAPDTRVLSAATDTRFTLAWRSPGAVRAALIDHDLRHPLAFEMPACTGDPALVGYGISALLACVRRAPGQPDALTLTRLRTTGAADPMATIPCPGGTCRAPALTRLGDAAWMAFIARDGAAESIYTVRIDLARKHAGPVVRFAQPEGTVGAVTLAAGDRSIAVAWTDTSAGSFALYSGAMDWRGTRGAAAQRLSIRHDGDPASLAWDGGAFGIAWSEPVGGGGADRSYFALLDRDGNRLGTQLRVYVEDDTAASHPSLRFTGRGYSLTYAATNNLVLERETGPRGCDAPP